MITKCDFINTCTHHIRLFRRDSYHRLKRKICDITKEVAEEEKREDDMDNLE